jgi:hypothetical protein
MLLGWDTNTKRKTGVVDKHGEEIRDNNTLLFDNGSQYVVSYYDKEFLLVSLSDINMLPISLNKLAFDGMLMSAVIIE